jgi:hypothetical protein
MVDMGGLEVKSGLDRASEFKTPAAPAVKREAEKGLGALTVCPSTWNQ